jgi:cytochrome c biogenesis protein CcmG/thiol:disulfide interchange protein DsbE
MSLRRLLYALPLLGFAAVALWFLHGLGRDPAAIPSALIDKPAPEFRLPPLEGSGKPALGPEDLRGRVTMVNFFASWCAPCRIEHPLLMRLAAERRVTLYGVSYKDAAADSRRFLVQLGDPYAAIGWDGNGRVAIDWGVYGVPETFVIDRNGVIRYKQIGPITPAALRDRILPLVRELQG